MKGIIKYLVGLSTVGILTVMWSQAHASGYKLEFQSASTLADAGEAAVVEDAGTNWYNSAGLVYLPQQLAMSGIGIYQTTTFNGSAVAPAAVPAFGFSDSGSATSHPKALLPAIHYVLPFKNNRFAFGLSVVPAWGLMEDYGNGSLVRYNLVRVYTKTIDVAPSIAMKLNDQWSIGVGPDIHYWSIQSSNHSRTQGPPLNTANDSISRFTANDWAKGWHAGLLFRMTEATRIGLNYRSQIVMHLKGYSDFDLNQIASFETNQFAFNVALPAVTTLSMYHDISPIWAIMGTIAYDQWSSIQAYYGKNYIGPSLTAPGTSVLTNVTSQQNLRNTFDFSIGAHYRLNDCWMLRGSFKYEPSPTINSLRTLTFPDGPKFGINIGARYRINPKLALDLVYAHVFTGTVPINDVNPASGATSSGHSSTRIDLAGAQLVWDI